MTALPAVHSSFSIERVYAASPAQVFAAFSDSERKRRWFAEGEGWHVDEFEADFRVGGHERSRFRYGDGPEVANDTTYLEILPDQRIVISYVMALSGKPFSASLTTIEFRTEGGHTRLVYSEHDSFLDGHDGSADRKSGCAELLETLALEVERVAA